MVRGRSRRFQVISWIVIAVVVLAAIGAGSGEESGSSKKSPAKSEQTAQTSTSSQSAPAPSGSTQTSTPSQSANTTATSTTSEKEKQKATNNARAAELKTFLKSTEHKEFIDDVKIESGRADVQTGFFWKKDNASDFVGVCNLAASEGMHKNWGLTEVVVYGSNGREGAEWIPSYAKKAGDITIIGCKSRVK